MAKVGAATSASMAAAPRLGTEDSSSTSRCQPLTTSARAYADVSSAPQMERKRSSGTDPAPRKSSAAAASESAASRSSSARRAGIRRSAAARARAEGALRAVLVG